MVKRLSPLPLKPRDISIAAQPFLLVKASFAVCGKGETLIRVARG